MQSVRDVLRQRRLGYNINESAQMQSVWDVLRQSRASTLSLG